MNPILKYILNLSAFQRVLKEESDLVGLAKVDALLFDLVNEKKIPGVSISVLKDGEVVLQKGYGYADFEKKTPIDPGKTIFRIASASKNIAATALAHMVADGLIDLDASFYEYVPYYPKKRWDFTIRQLASHIAGIRGYQGTEYGLNEPYSIKEGIEIFKDDDLLFEPGTNYHYNSYDWVLVSLAMQEVSGIPFENYVQEKVLNPLGMTNTFHRDPSTMPRVRSKLAAERNRSGSRAGKIEDMATFYSTNRLGFRKAIPVSNFYKLAGGGYLSTSEDLAKFGQAYLDGKILNDTVLTQFLTSQTTNGFPTYYGLGWQVSEDKKGRPFYGHVGNGVGGYSNFFVYPDERMVFAILINCTDPKVQEELDFLVETIVSIEWNGNTVI
ncbi:MAG: serine hydrolase domain-containing protein [Aurantibacter sp.]